MSARQVPEVLAPLIPQEALEECLSCDGPLSAAFGDDDGGPQKEDDGYPDGMPEHGVVRHPPEVREARVRVELRVQPDELEIRETEIDGVADRQEEEEAEQRPTGGEEDETCPPKRPPILSASEIDRVLGDAHFGFSPPPTPGTLERSKRSAPF